jgi:hypothetical protein
MAPRTRSNTPNTSTKKPRQKKTRAVWNATRLTKLVDFAILRKLEWSKNNKAMKENEKMAFAVEVQERNDATAVKAVMAKWNEIRAACVKANTYVKAMQAEKEKSGSSNHVQVDYEETF